MTTETPESIGTHGLITFLVPVADLEAAKPFYATLFGTDPVADQKMYVGFQVGDQHVGLLPGGGPQKLTAPVAYWTVADLDAAVDALVAAGATVTEAAHEVGGGRSVATVTDVDGNAIGLSHDS